MLKRLFLLLLRARLPPLLMLRPNLPSLPFRSRALRSISDVDGRRSFVVALSKLGSAVAKAVPEPVPEPLVLFRQVPDFFVGVSEALPVGVFLLRMSDVDERRGLTEMERYGDGLADRGTYSWYCKSAEVEEVVGVTSSMRRLGAIGGLRFGIFLTNLVASPTSASLELLVSLRVIFSIAFRFWLIDLRLMRLELRLIFIFDFSSAVGDSFGSTSLPNEKPRWNDDASLNVPEVDVGIDL